MKRTPNLSRWGFLLIFCLLASLFGGRVRAGAQDYFVITVTDADTGRGVPLVELKTTNEQKFYTDSNGVVAINEPDLMGQNVYFLVKSHGYDFPADGFGNRGVAFQVTPGGKAQVKITRVNIAERLYRLTGAGIYRDSVLAGLPVPIKQPLLNGQVMGQDTVEVTPYRGKLYWFFGDTNKPSYPLGQFATSGATSLLPGQGGLDPGKGVDLTYWVDESGFSKKMIPLPGFGGPVWVGGLFTLPDAQGRERLLTRYAHLDGSGKTADEGLAIFNDDKALFEKVQTYDLKQPLKPEGHPFRATVKGQTYLYFEPTTGGALPLVRVPADMTHVLDQRAYEGFTCLAPGSRFDGANTELDRDAQGHLIYAWKSDTPPLSYDQQHELIQHGKMAPQEAPFILRDIETDDPIQSANGSTFWNPYRHRWVMITAQSFGGPSFLGELWFAEADTPTGPWVYARKIITHDHYTFYNPTQHPFFDQDGGRLIYLEGTYTDSYSNNPEKTPRYNYNQIMYRLSLDDRRLSLPAPVYRLKGPNGAITYGMRETVDVNKQWPQVQDIAFYAIPPSRSHDGLIPLYAVRPPKGGMTLQTTAPAGAKTPLCYVLPATPADKEKLSPAVVPLIKISDPQPGAPTYAASEEGGFTLCRVWRNPASSLPLDDKAKPVP